MATEPYIKVTSYEQAEALLQYGHCIFLGYDPAIVAIRVSEKKLALSFYREFVPHPVQEGYYNNDIFKQTFDAALETNQMIYAEKLPTDFLENEIAEYRRRHRER
jgi:hypothetical protein